MIRRRILVYLGMILNRQIPADTPAGVTLRELALCHCNDFREPEEICADLSALLGFAVSPDDKLGDLATAHREPARV